MNILYDCKICGHFSNLCGSKAGVRGYKLPGTEFN